MDAVGQQALSAALYQILLAIQRHDIDHARELVIEQASGEEAFKLPPGHLVTYPATFLHRVAPVRRGRRHEAFSCRDGWRAGYHWKHRSRAASPDARPHPPRRPERP